MLICAMIIDYWMRGKLNIHFVEIKAVNVHMLFDINTKSGDTLTPHHLVLVIDFIQHRHEQEI